MSKEHLRQLKDKDPNQRKAAIKALARAKEKAAIVPLAKMSGDDPDPEVRDLAGKAGRYILEQTGGMAEMERKAAAKQGADAPAAPPPPDKKGGHPRFAVSEEDKHKALRMLDEAMNDQMRGERGKGMRVLSKALSVDPNLRYDPYFTSLAESFTGLPPDEAVSMLDNKELQHTANESVLKARKNEAIEAHMAEISKATWRDVAFDLAIYLAIVIVGVVIVHFVAIQSANRYLAFVEKNNTVDFPRATCLAVEGEIICRMPPTPDEAAVNKAGRIIEPITLDIAFQVELTTAKDLQATTILVRGVLGGLLATALLLVMSIIVHGLSATVLGGHGRFAHTAHQIIGLLMNRTLLLIVLAGVGLMLYLGGNGATIATVVISIAGLLGLMTLFTLLGRVGKAYDYGIVKAFVATAVALAVVGGISFGVGMNVL